MIRTPEVTAFAVPSDDPFSPEKETLEETLKRLFRSTGSHGPGHQQRSVEQHEQNQQDEAWDCKECLSRNPGGVAECEYCGTQRGKGRLEWARSDAPWEERDGKVYLPPPELVTDSECTPAEGIKHHDRTINQDRHGSNSKPGVEFPMQWIFWIQRRWLHVKSGLIFQDQGSQYVMMLCGGHGQIRDIAKLHDYCAKAHQILGYDIMQLCSYGPEAELSQPKHCQPAMFLAGVVGLEKLREISPAAAENPRCVAGRSVGEYSALYAAGVFTFEDGLRLVSIRGRAMQEAAQASCGRPFTWSCFVMNLDREHLDQICKEHTAGNDLAVVSEVMFPDAFVCSGTKDAIMKVQAACIKAGAQAKAAVGLSLPSPLMNTAQTELDAALNEMIPKMKPPKCDVYMNVTGRRIKAGTPPSEIVPFLINQLTKPVLWEHSLRSMMEDEVNTLYEIGTVWQLKAYMKRIKPKMSERITSILV